MADKNAPNKAQIEAITSTDGPMLIIAGPGTGKTTTLVKRTIHLITEKKVSPSSIFIATFTEKAADQLISRITAETEKPETAEVLAKNGIKLNLDDMYIGTFHAICLKILKDYSNSTDLQNFRTLDRFGQQYLIFRHLNKFVRFDKDGNIIQNTDDDPNDKGILNFGKVIKLTVKKNDGSEGQKTKWFIAGDICSVVNRINEELVSIEKLLASDDPAVVAAGKILQTYAEILEKDKFIDFAGMQTKVYELLTKDPDVLTKLREKISHVLIDEYQDTNFVQEQIAFLIAGDRKNICVVGDDDQGIYRFRGATIRNILEFSGKFGETKCKKVYLTTNYRSDPQIIDFFNKWMDPDQNSSIKFKWNEGKKQFRFPKTIVPCEKRIKQRSKMTSPAVIKLSTNGYGEDVWYKKISDFLHELYESKKITDYNQVAFLFSAVTNEKAKALSASLEKSGINVYNPRANMFFDRPEIRFTLACLLYMFPWYSMTVTENDETYGTPINDYYKDILLELEEIKTKESEKSENTDFWTWLSIRRQLHEKMIFDDGEENTDKKTRKAAYTFSSMLYSIYSLYPPFRKLLGSDLASTSATDTRPLRNLAILTDLITTYEDVSKLRKLNSVNVKKNTERLFGQYLKYQRLTHVDEDDTEYAPSGCVSFLTIHQAKGLEFPVVFVDSLYSKPEANDREIMLKLEKQGYARAPYEPDESIKYFDFWRLYYTAFSRAKNLLVLTCQECPKTKKGYECPSEPFKSVYNDLVPNTDDSFDIKQFTFEPVADPDIKQKFSFTSHISVYDTCALQYKFYRELGFIHVRSGAMMFGTLVHATIEDIHRAAMQKEYGLITDDNIRKWFYSNYELLAEKENQTLGESQKNQALDQALNYAHINSDDWDNIVSTEEDVSIIMDEYIIEGKIDLIRA